MNEKEKINFDEVDEQTEQIVEIEGTSLDDVQSGKYIKTAKVGEETGWIKIIDFIRRNPKEAVNKETGKKFSDALKPMEVKQGQKLYAYYLVTENGLCRITSWEVYFKILALKDLLKIPKWKDCNVEVNIKHEFDGMGRDASNQKAKEENRLFRVLVKENGVEKTIVAENKGNIKIYKLV